MTWLFREVDSASVIIAVLTHWDANDKEVSRAAVVRTIELLGSDMSCCVLTVGEMCSLMNKLAERHIRDKKLLPLLSARITELVLDNSIAKKDGFSHNPLWKYFPVIIPPYLSVNLCR
ncbi:unnamed protein product [Cylicostephanus goldi]|uniref:Uncharacterized protein n=1 Tax=Cylicostephanus goldi TaxID=71465 RepID=A0A3P7R083_CYLGO|nr:unnamed protein product [Cylicostephanus goldi]